MMLFPLITLFILVIFIGIPVYFIFRKNWVSKKKILNTRKTYSLFIGYSSVLILVMFLFLYVAFPISGNDLDQVKRHQLDYDALLNKNLEKNEQFIDKKWEFEINNEVLYIQSKKTLSAGILRVLVERMDTEDAVVEVIHFQVPTYVHDYDVTNLLNPVEVTVSEDKMFIAQKPSELNLTAFELEFPLKQFAKKASYSDDPFLNERLHFSQAIFYIRLPKGTHIEADDVIDISFIE